MPRQLRAGVGEVVITPPLGVELSGYGYALERRATGVLDDLRAVVVLLDDGSERLAVVGLDLLGVSRALARQLRSVVAARTGLTADRILLACSHTHAAPAVLYLRNCGEICPDYLALLPRHVGRAAEQAQTNLQPATWSRGWAIAPALGYNRVDPAGPVHRQVVVISIDELDGTPLLVMPAFACHPVTLTNQNTLISRDFLGPVADWVRTEYDGALWLPLQGAAGDINPHRPADGDLRRLAADALRAAVAEAMAARQPLGEPRLGALSRDTALPLAPPDPGWVGEQLAAAEARLVAAGDQVAAQRLARVDLAWLKAESGRLADGAPAVWPSEVQALRLTADCALAAFGGEVFTSVGEAVRSGSPLADTLFVGYANDFVGYIPDQADFTRGGYAAAQVPKLVDNHPFRPDVGDHLAEAMVGVLGHLAARGD